MNKDQNVEAQVSRSSGDIRDCSIHGCFYDEKSQSVSRNHTTKDISTSKLELIKKVPNMKKEKEGRKGKKSREGRERLTSKSFGVFLASGSFNKQLSTKSSASLGNLPSGVNLGAGSFTICCSSSKILIVIPPPCKLTPLLFRFFLLSAFSFSALLRAGGRGREGDSVPSNSDRSESSSSDSAKGKRPRASSISEIPRDQTSDLTVY